MNKLNTVFQYRIPAQKVKTFKLWNYFKDATMKKLLLYILFDKVEEHSGSSYDIIC